MALTDIGREAAEATSNGGGGDSTESEYERVEVSGMDFVAMHPGPTAIKGTANVLRYLPPAPEDDGSYADDARGDAGLLLENPTVPDDEDFDGVGIFQADEDQSGDDYKVVNLEDEEIDEYDVGISVRSMFESEQVDEFDADEVVFKLSSGAGRSVARTLDVSGLADADVVRNDDGEPEIQDNGFPTTNDALIESHPGNDDDNYTQPRYSRDPQLRPDVEGKEVIIMLQRTENVIEDYSGNSHWATVLVDLGDDRQDELAEEYAEDPYYDSDDPADFIHEINGTEYLRMAPTMEFEPDDDLLYETQWMNWRWPSSERIDELADEQGVDA